MESKIIFVLCLGMILILAACTAQEAVPSSVETGQEEIMSGATITYDELTYLLGNTKTSQECNSLLYTIAEIEGTLVHDRSAGFRETPSRHFGIRTDDDCIFYLNVPIDSTDELGSTIRTKGWVWNGNLPSYQIDSSITKPPTCPEEPACPEKQVVITRYYDSGRIGHCPMSWECQ